MLGRVWLLVAMVFGGLAAVGMAVRGSRLPPADFTFFNESEVKSLDPAIINGEPEGRIARSLFEGLTRPRPDNMRAEPGMAAASSVLRQRAHSATRKTPSAGASAARGRG